MQMGRWFCCKYTRAFFVEEGGILLRPRGGGDSFPGRCPGEWLSEEYQNLGTTPEGRGTVKHPANRRTAKNIDRFIGVAELVN